MTRRPPRKGRRPRPSGAGAGARWPGPTPLEVIVDALGARGDGLARHDAERLFVPATLPGERVRVRATERTTEGWRAAAQAILDPSPDRTTPPCPHFGPCGGCTLQHMAPAALADWKRRQIGDALARRGLTEAAVDPVVAIAPGSRRRATLGWRRTAAGVVLGFHTEHSHRLEDVRHCALLAPALADALRPLRDALADAAPSGGHGQVWLTETDTGLDATVSLSASPDLAMRERLARLAAEADLARIGLHTGASVEPVAVRRPPVVRIAGVPVAVPPRAFLQPSADGAAAITQAVLARLPPGTGPALDLYAGLGTLSLPLALTGRAVHAVDATPEPLAALAAARPARGRITTEVRDLAQDPLDGAALGGTAVAVFDPPRAGARAQAAALAAAGPAVVIAVSCRPATFARDARCLVDGGYRMETVTPIDQFPWSPHVELVAAFRRPE